MIVQSQSSQADFKCGNAVYVHEQKYRNHRTVCAYDWVGKQELTNKVEKQYPNTYPDTETSGTALSRVRMYSVPSDLIHQSCLSPSSSESLSKDTLSHGDSWCKVLTCYLPKSHWRLQSWLPHIYARISTFSKLFSQLEKYCLIWNRTAVTSRQREYYLCKIASSIPRKNLWFFCYLTNVNCE